MLHLLARRMLRNKAPSKGPSEGLIVNVQLLAPPAPDPVLRRETEVGLGKEDPTVLQAPCPAVLTLIPLDLGPDRTLLPRKG